MASAPTEKNIATYTKFKIPKQPLHIQHFFLTTSQYLLHCETNRKLKIKT
ncbi:hypothetical protein RND71_007965 [Anisodus tanguticus]|uniref:Uncharacterized protein n=1 Tax=Anisodus tanguticus TaxID=243964 RepID=A0AAE1VQ80_9SOLA|nr:hypothetical protein RND71_007965 [Anisodus tanguticus]